MMDCESDTRENTLSTRHTARKRRAFLKAGVASATGLLTGCAGLDTDSEATEETAGGRGDGTVTGVAGDESDLSGTTIDMLDYEAAQARATREVLPLFEEGTGITVNLKTAPYSDLVSEQFASLSGDSTTTYDVVAVDVPYWPTFVSNDWIQPLNGFLDRSDIFRRDFIERIWDDTVVWGSPLDYLDIDQNNVMGIPYQPNVLTLYYRTDLYREAGLSPPDTFSGYQQAARELTDPEEDIYGMAMMAEQHESLLVEWKSMLYARGGRFFEGESIEQVPFGISETWEPVFDGETGMETLKFYKSLVNASYTSEDVTNWDWTDVTQNFIEGRLATAQAFSSTAYVANDPAQSEITGKVGYSLYPGSKASGSLLRRPHYGTWSLAIPNNSGKKRAAWELIRWLSLIDIQIERAKYGAQPSRKTAYEHLMKPENEFFPSSPAFFETLYLGLIEYGIGRPKIKGYFEWSNTMQKWLNRSITEGMDSREALSNAADETRMLLEQRGYY